jgi:hypothetical protein
MRQPTVDADANEVDDFLERLRIDRTPVVVWGHVEGTHTHSWIHYGFYRALKHMGLEASWLDDTRRNAHRLRDVERAVIITEGQADDRLKKVLRPKWIVFGHNSVPEDYRDRCRFVPVHVDMLDQTGYRNPRWHPGVRNAPEAEQSANRVAPLDQGINVLWATDLLPHEIQFTPHRTDGDDVVFVGTVWSYNAEELEQFSALVAERGLRWEVHQNVDAVRHEQIVRSARFAPALQGAWQVDHGYIPCRLFKNISYSQLGLSNNPSALKIFDKDELVCRTSMSDMIDAALEAEEAGIVDDMVRGAQNTVRERHTYINRVRELLAFHLEHVAPAA